MDSPMRHRAWGKACTKYRCFEAEWECVVTVQRPLARRIEELEGEIKRSAGRHDFNIDAPNEVAEVLFKTLKLEVPRSAQPSKHAASKHISTNNDVGHPVPSTAFCVIFAFCVAVPSCMQQHQVHLAPHIIFPDQKHCRTC